MFLCLCLCLSNQSLTTQPGQLKDLTQKNGQRMAKGYHIKMAKGWFNDSKRMSKCQKHFPCSTLDIFRHKVTLTNYFVGPSVLAPIAPRSTCSIHGLTIGRYAIIGSILTETECQRFIRRND